MPSAKTYSERNGDGPWECRYAVRWEKLWEVRSDLPTRRTARVLLCVYREHLVALHGFIKKTRATPDDDLRLAPKRKKELEQ